MGDPWNYSVSCGGGHKPIQVVKLYRPWHTHTCAWVLVKLGKSA